MAVLAASGCTTADQADAEAGASPTPAEASTGRFATTAGLGLALREAALEAGTARGTIEASSVDGTVDADLAYVFSDNDVRIAGEASVSGPISADLGIVLADGTVYIRVPPLYRLFTSAAWVQVPQDSSSDLGREIDGLVEAFAAEVPGASLLDLESGLVDADLRFVGDDEVAGIPVERYEVSASVDGVDVTRTYWIDADDLLRRLDSTANEPAVARPAVSTSTYDDWAAPIRVEVPDAADVADFPEGLF